ncbi:SNG1 family protein [Paenibacillus sp. N1-5-1-14]|uniref:YhgE/Pip domain-containing protein n=1 Tax=Paenibacillus radicibacter TaxID=2972488 RepID=UPI002158A834|nr:SNG1 family protein [Paenibacillus radicibacter]MCR8645749.1 SNG1 family protein [Paenibacillus radicibacter]
MSLFRQKLIWVIPVIVLLIVFVFSLPSATSIHAAPKSLPLALLNEDQGPISKKIVEQLTATVEQAEAKGKTSPIKWVQVTSTDELTAGLNEQAYYGALVISDSFTSDMSSMQTAAPKPAALKVMINSGMNPSGVGAATQILQNMTDMINSQMRTQLLTGFEQQGKTLTAAQAKVVSQPITKTVENVNAPGDKSGNGAAPISLFQPLWLSVMMGTMAVFILTTKLNARLNLSRGNVVITQLLIGIVLAFAAGFGVTSVAKWIVGVNIPSYAMISLFLVLTYYCFYLMILSILSWIGPGALVIFLLLFFFGLPVLTVAPELLPTFAHDWLYTWFPMRFTVEGLRAMMYFGADLTNSDFMVIAWIGLGGLILLLTSIMKPRTAAQKKLLASS